METKEKTVVLPWGLSKALDQAMAEYKLLYITAPTGWGKTTSVCRYFKARRHTYVSLREEDALDQAEADRTGLILVDDCHMLAGRSLLQERLAGLLRSLPPNGQAVLMNRAPLPDWLLPFQLSGILTIIPETAFQMGAGDAANLASALGVSLSQEDVLRLYQDTWGHPMTIRLVCFQLAEGRPLNAETVQNAYDQMFACLDQQLFRFWDARIRRLLLSISFFDSFTLELARAVTGDSQTEQALEHLTRISGFLDREGEGYTIRYVRLRDYLRHKAETIWTDQERAALYANAGAYYQLRGDLPAALDCWSMGGNSTKVSELLVEHSRLHPGHGVYYQLRRYYRSLPEREILASPELMSGMSILCSLTFDIEGSERWYSALKNYAGGMSRRAPNYRAVQGLVSYLDIALPHRGSVNIKNILMAAFGQLRAGKISLPEFSVTSNLPSVLRGGKDFSSWVPSDWVLYNLLGAPVEFLLGRQGVGLADIALAESRYEKGEDISDTYLTLSSCRVEIQQKGAPEMEFVLTALMAKCQCDQGNLDQAVRNVAAFRARMEEERQLLPNIDALLCRFALLTGGEEAGPKPLPLPRSEEFTLLIARKEVHRWFVEQAPDEDDFFIMERYRYLTKVRCYLQQGEYLSALSLLGRLLDYFERYDRTLDRIEGLILLAICRSRMGEGDWQKHLSAALELARPYGYITVFAHEGAALLPLLRTLEGDEYLTRVEQRVRAFAAQYPNYLSAAVPIDVQSLTKKELEVLRLIGRNKSNEEIRGILGISENTLKTHIRKLFKKLGAANRIEAKAAAERLHL